MGAKSNATGTVLYARTYKRLYFALGAALALVAAIIAAYEYGKARQLDDIQQAVTSAISHSKLPPAPDPKFTVEPADHTAEAFTWRGWSITNLDASPLIIRRVIYNGERTAHLGLVHVNGAILDTEKAGEVTLGIGQSQAYFQSLSFTVTPGDYFRDIIFIDVYTNRGDFRYQPFKGFAADKPVYDAQKVHNEDARAAAAAEQDEKERRNPVKP